MLAGIGLTWATYCLKVKIRVEYRGCWGKLTFEPPVWCPWAVSVHVEYRNVCQREGDEKAEEFPRRASTISITQEACTHFYTITLLWEEQPQSIWPQLRERQGGGKTENYTERISTDGRKLSCFSYKISSVVFGNARCEEIFKTWRNIHCSKVLRRHLIITVS